MYIRRARHARNRLLKVTGIEVSALALAGAGAISGLAVAQASTIVAGQDGTQPPPGFGAVLLSETVGPAGGTLPTVTSDGATYTLTVPPGAFPAKVQITLTTGSLATLAPAAFPGYMVVSAIGVQVALDGAAYPGTFLKPLTLITHGSSYDASSVAGIWNGTSLLPYSNVTSAPGVVTISSDSDPDFAVMSPSSRSQRRVAKATSPMTGKPVAGEGILAGVLLAAGISGLVVRRRTARHRGGTP